jgi:hypothetical protein
MASNALRRLAAQFGSTLIISGGNIGNSGNNQEEPRFSCFQNARTGGNSGNDPDVAVAAVAASDDALATDKALKSPGVAGVAAVTAETDRGESENAARPAVAPERPAQPDGYGLGESEIGEHAFWYEQEGNRRRVGLVLDQRALDNELRQRLENCGVFPEFIGVEFERVMQVVFAEAGARAGAEPKPEPKPRQRPPLWDDHADEPRPGDRCEVCNGNAFATRVFGLHPWMCTTCYRSPGLPTAYRVVRT